MSEKFVITIARQFGSMGKQIAKEVAGRLDVPFYDRELVDEAAKRMGMKVSTVKNLEEKAGGRFFGMKYPAGLGDAASQREIFETQKEIILGLAQKESCIIVGRCSDYILQDIENALHVYIYGSYEKRYLNCLELLRMHPTEAKAMIKDIDKARVNYHKTFAGYAPDDPLYKDCMLNSGRLGVKGTADVLEAIAREKFHLE